MASDIVSPLESTIENRLDSTSRLIRRVDLALSLLIILSLILGGLFLAILADHWLLKDGLSMTLRFGIFFAIAFAAGYYIYRKVVPLFRYAINPVYTANLIEKDVSVFKNSLINWLLIRREHVEQTESPIDKTVYNGMLRTAAVNVQTIPTVQPVDIRGLIRIGTFFTILLTLFIGYAALSPKSPLASIGRVLFPFSGIERPQAVQFRNVKPGNMTALQGENVTISAEVVSQSPEEVYLVFSTDDGQAVEQRIPMVQHEGQIAFETPFPPGKQGTERGFNSSVDYWIAQGESRSKQYRIEVFPTASIEVVSVQYKFPEYTGLPIETIEHTGDVKALEGTEVTVAVRSTLPLKDIAIVFNENPAGKVAMQISGEPKTEAKGTFTLAINSPRKTFAFEATDENGNVSRRSGIYQIEVIPDQSPKVQWADTATHLKNLRIDLPENQTLQLPIQAEDPDFALRYLNLKMKSTKNEQTRIPEVSLLTSLATGPTEHKGQITKNEVFSPEKSRITAGDTIEIWAEVMDTKYPPREGKEKTKETDRLTVNIVAPEKKEEQKKDSEQDKEQDGKEGDSEQSGEQPPNEEKQNEGQNDQQQDQSEGEKQDGKEGSPEQNEPQEGEQQDEGEPKQDESKEGKDEHKEKGNQPNEQDPQEQNPNGQEPPKKENPEQQPKPDPQAQGNQNQGGSSGGGEQQEGQEGANKGQASDEPSENDPSEGSEQSQDNQTGGNQKESNDQANQQDSAQGSADSGKPQEGDPSAGADAPNAQSGEQQGNSGGNGQDSQQQPSDTPINPETQDGDAMERIVEQMKEEGKFDENGSGNNATPMKSMDNSKKLDSPLSGLNKDLHNDDPNSRRDDSLDPDSENLSNQGNDPSNPQQSNQPGKGQQQSPAENPQNGEQQSEQQAESGAGSENPQDSNSQGTSPQEQPDESATGEEQSQSNDAGNDGESSQGSQPQGNSAQEQSGQGEQGSQSQPGQQGNSGQQQSAQPREQGGQQGEGQQGNSPSTQQPSQGNQANPNQPDGQGSQQTGGTGGGGGAETKTVVEDPNLEYADKVTNLVLEYLEDQLRDKPKDELLKKLGWSEDQLRQFYDKWQKMASENRTPKQENGKSPWEEALKSLGLTPNRGTAGLQKKPTIKDKTRITESQRFEPPAAMKDKYKRYTEGIGK